MQEGNPKSEIRNPKQAGSAKGEIRLLFRTRTSPSSFAPGHFGFQLSDFLRVSGFGFRISLVVIALLLGRPLSLRAYPEFRAFIVQHSGRPVDCAMCHVNHDGPQGTGSGQIGGLGPAELEQLGRARTAFAPGSKAENPILNAFGNHIVQSIGLTKFRELRLAPAQLAKALPQDSDLDGDGIPDVQEYLEGTNPTDPDDGRPWLLFKNNFRRNLSQILLTLAATAAGLYGLSHLLRGFAKATEIPSEDEPEHELAATESEPF